MSEAVLNQKAKAFKGSGGVFVYYGTQLIEYYRFHPPLSKP